MAERTIEIEIKAFRFLIFSALAKYALFVSLVSTIHFD